MNLKPKTITDWTLIGVACLVVLMLFAQEARADRLMIGGWSTHLISKDTTNSSHKVLGVETHGWAAGYFQNSYDRPTWFVNKAWRWDNVLGVEHLEFMAGVGASYGYRSCWGDKGSHARLCPDGVVGIAWTRWRVVPSVKLKGDALVFSPEIKF
ncbi:MAG: hypothetical protein FKY71_18020 [Spiribacter salinus]|uniref:Uncharacterized protein n=1 Tax=Spiribacter salinus TaxID=1335746 RepID=A0A540VAJ3_9GAMM|nr:MAG: hypothetical protein FKY71_18020 [Spiribacter salinus]